MTAHRHRLNLPPMHWTLLFFAALLEIVWATGLKSTDGFTRLYG
jgi:multidrug transporter EmrE-like cation transporter